MTQVSAAELAVKSPGDPMAFYIAAATVLPVLLVALIYQANILKRMPWESDSTRPPDLKGFAYWILYWNLAAETTAFIVLGAQTPSTHTKVFVGVAMFMSATTLVWRQTTLSLGNHMRRLEREQQQADLRRVRRELRVASFFFPLALAVPFVWWALWSYVS